MTYHIHPYAELFPQMNDEALRELTNDIRTNGLIEPIVIYQDQILDGRNRFTACGNAGVKPHFIAFDGDDDAALKYVISKNLHRRHMTSSQRSMVAARIADAKQGRKSEEKISNDTNLADAAKQMKVGRASAARARKVIKSGDDELIAEVDAGRMPVSRAAEIVDLPKEERAAAVKAPRKKPAEPVGRDDCEARIWKVLNDAAEEFGEAFVVDVIDRWSSSII